MAIEQDNQSSSEDSWAPCSAGELSRMVKRIHTQRRRARIKQVYSAAAASMLVVAAAVLLSGYLPITGNVHHGGISCAQCASHFDEYHAHLTGGTTMADTDLVDSMATHLTKCPVCRDQFELSYPDVLSANLSIETGFSLLALQPNFSVAIHPMP